MPRCVSRHLSHERKGSRILRILLSLSAVVAFLRIRGAAVAQKSSNDHFSTKRCRNVSFSASPFPRTTLLLRFGCSGPVAPIFFAGPRLSRVRVAVCDLLLVKMDRMLSKINSAGYRMRQVLVSDRNFPGGDTGTWKGRFALVRQVKP